MNNIGIFIRSLRIDDTVQAIRKAKELGFGSIQLWNVDGELSPENLNKESLMSILDIIKSLSLKVSSLGGYMDFTESHGIESKIKKFKEIMELSLHFRAPIVCTESGRKFDSRGDDKPWQVLIESMKDLSSFGEKRGIYIAIEPGPRDLIDSPKRMRELAIKVGSPNLKINYDPANIIKAGYDPVEGVYQLRDLIVHTHIKDATRKEQKPLGKGMVDFQKYLSALDKIGYNGFLTIEQEYSIYADAIKNIAKDKSYLESILNKIS